MERTQKEQLCKMLMKTITRINNNYHLTQISTCKIITRPVFGILDRFDVSEQSNFFCATQSKKDSLNQTGLSFKHALGYNLNRFALQFILTIRERIEKFFN